MAKKDTADAAGAEADQAVSSAAIYGIDAFIDAHGADADASALANEIFGPAEAPMHGLYASGARAYEFRYGRFMGIIREAS